MATNNNKSGKLFVISAPSGAGKTSLIKEVIKRLNNQYDISRVITYTNRSPRENETEGKDYYFLNSAEFDKRFKNNFFLETNVYNGKYYGSSTNILTDLEMNKILIAITDINGAKSLNQAVPKAILIWITAPNMEELKRRLLSRGNMSNTQIEKRMQIAQEETKEAHKSRLFKFNVVNDVFEQTIAELIKILKKETE
ncbi:guanylate kinase [Candidatus Babeliales bacterium]|nr:guanylate kinase [Candidatus Babeliales bacterium]